MNKFNSAFRSASGAESFLIKFAREEGTNKKIYLPGDMFKTGGEAYDPARHKGHLLCGDKNCTAHIEVRSPRAGSAGAREHFSTIRGEKHIEHCEMRKPVPEEKLENYRGAIIDLKTGGIDQSIHPKQREKIDYQGHYARGEHTSGTLRARQEDLRGLEVIEMRHIDRLTEFLATKSPAYINNSLVRYRDFLVPWRFFMIRYGKVGGENEDQRFKALVSAMRENGQKFMPVLMEIIPRESYYPHKLEMKPWVLSKKIPYDGGNIVPRVFINTDHSYVRTGFMDPKERRLILALAVLSQKDDYLLDLTVTDPLQFSKAQLKDISTENRRNQRAEPLVSGPQPDIRP